MGGAVNVSITGDAPPFQVAFELIQFGSTNTISMSSNGSASVNFGCNETVVSITVTDASGQSITQSVGFWYPCGFNAIMSNPIPTIEVCSGELIDAGDLNAYLQSGWYLATAAHFIWSNSNTGTGIPSTGQTNGTFQFMAPNVSSTEISYVEVAPYDPYGTGFCYVEPGTLQVIVNPLPTVDAGNAVVLCEGDSVQLNGTGAGTLTWSNGVSNNSFYTPAITGSEQLILTATTVQGCSDTAPLNVTVNPLPVVDAGPDLSVCTGDSVQLNATGVGTIAWSTGTINGSEYAPAGPELVVATLTDGNGCSTSDSVLITVHPLPTIEAGLPQTICAGDSVVLSGAGGVSYIWNNGVVNDVAFVPNVSGWYTLMGTDTNGCVTQDSVEITVNPLPAIHAGADTILCQFDSLVLTANGGVSYVWSNGVMDSMLFEVVSDQTYTVLGTDANGCQATDTVMVFVHPLPMVAAGTDITLCNGDSAQLLASGAMVYNWNNGIQNGDFVFPTTDTQYTVEGVDANGCRAVDSILVTIAMQPLIDAGSDILACENDVVMLSATGSPGTITWSGNPNPLSVPVTPGATWYIATVVDSSGCIAEDSVLVIGDAIPEPFFNADITQGCAPLEVTFTNTTTGNFTDCFWTFGNQTSVSDCGAQTVTYNESGYYDVTLSVTTVGGCMASETLVDYIYVESDPISDFTIFPSTITGNNPTVETNNQSIGATSYQWNFGDNSGFGYYENESHTYTIESEQSFTVELVAYSPLLCTDTAWQSVVVEQEVVFFVPNAFTPNGDEFNNFFAPVITSGIDWFNFEFIIFNRWGERIFETQNPNVGWDGTYNGVNVQDGTYTWRMEFKVRNRDERQVHHGHVNVLK